MQPRSSLRCVDGFSAVHLALSISLCPCLSLRLVEIRVRVPGFRVRNYVIVTTLLDPIEWSVERLGQLYDLPLERISFKGTVDTLRHWAGEIGRHADKPRKQAAMLNALFLSSCRDRCGVKLNLQGV